MELYEIAVIGGTVLIGVIAELVCYAPERRESRRRIAWRARMNAPIRGK